MIRTLLPLAALGLAIAAPASAGNDKTPPGDPCSKGNGNPCNGNNGNDGSQGNGRKKVTYGTPGPIDIQAPAFSGRGVYVTQIGYGDRAVVRQTAREARTDIVQDGERNAVSVGQDGSGRAYASVAQLGNLNQGTVAQSGAGQSTLYLAQLGAGNVAAASQASIGSLYNGAVMTQKGDDNRMTLDQAGQDNRALLSQTGDANQMTASQTGAGNRLAWTQEGSNLADLRIAQTGGSALMVTQTGK